MMDFSKLTKHQYLMVFSYSLAQFFNAACVSIQAPFFPQEAESKGATASEYGLVFGVFELVVFLISPWYGKNLGRISPDLMFVCGIMTTASSSILFGFFWRKNVGLLHLGKTGDALLKLKEGCFLDVINGHILFIVLAFLLRIIEAMGSAAFLAAGFAIVAHEFPDNISSMFATLESFYGLGLIVGPTIGGILYQMGGFTLPFVSVGVCLLICAALTRFALPTIDKYQRTGTNSVWRILRIKGMSVFVGITVTVAMTITFISVTLEPHIRQFGLSPIQVGLIFIVNGAFYAITAPAWGWLCDSKYIQPKAISILGGIILVVGVSFLGPAPYIPLHTSLGYILLGLVLQGISNGARLVSSFTDAMQISAGAGIENSVETYGVIFAIWMSSLSFGGFIGPTVSGFLYDHYGFANASLFIILLTSVMIIWELWSLLDFHRTKSHLLEYENAEERKPILEAQI